MLKIQQKFPLYINANFFNNIFFYIYSLGYVSWCTKYILIGLSYFFDSHIKHKFIQGICSCRLNRRRHFFLKKKRTGGKLIGKNSNN